MFSAHSRQPDVLSSQQIVSSHFNTFGAHWQTKGSISVPMGDIPSDYSSRPKQTFIIHVVTHLTILIVCVGVRIIE